MLELSLLDFPRSLFRKLIEASYVNNIFGAQSTSHTLSAESAFLIAIFLHLQAEFLFRWSSRRFFLPRCQMSTCNISLEEARTVRLEPARN